MPSDPQSILIINIRLIGDVILTTPLIEILHTRYPQADIDLLLNHGTGEFLKNDPRVRRIITVANKEFCASKKQKHSEPYYLRSILRRYDWAINMNSSDRGNFAAILAGRNIRIGFSDPPKRPRDFWKQWGFTHHLNFHDDRHVARRCAQVADSLGIPVDRLWVSVRWNDADRVIVDDFCRQHSVQGDYFVLHPFARWQYKYWRGERFAEVSDHLTRQHGLKPVWTSSPDPAEVDLLNEAATRARVPPVLVPGLLTLNQMSYLLSRARFYLGLDTAVTHIAASHGLPLLALYGPTLTHRWHPWNNQAGLDQQPSQEDELLINGPLFVARKNWTCVPCGTSSCDDQGGPSPCLQELSVAEVIDAVDRCLAERG